MPGARVARAVLQTQFVTSVYMLYHRCSDAVRPAAIVAVQACQVFKLFEGNVEHLGLIVAVCSLRVQSVKAFPLVGPPMKLNEDVIA